MDTRTKRQFYKRARGKRAKGQKGKRAKGKRAKGQNDKRTDSRERIDPIGKLQNHRIDVLHLRDMCILVCSQLYLFYPSTRGLRKLAYRNIASYFGCDNGFNYD